MTQRSEKQSFLRDAVTAATCFLGGVLVAGCDLPKRPVLHSAAGPRAESASQTLRTAKLEVVEPPGDLVESRWETWDAYFVNGQHVGYNHMVAEPVGGRSSDQIRYLLENRLYANHGRCRVLQRLQQTSRETADGRLNGFEAAMHVGPVATRFFGTMQGEDLAIETVQGSCRTRRHVPWRSTYRGLVGIEQSLKNRPLRNKEETRLLKLLLPGQYQLATARLRCDGNATIPLLDGALEVLTEINCEIRMGESDRSYSTIWTDDDGRIVKTFSPALQLTAYRTDQETATPIASNDMVALAIQVKGELRRPSEAKQVAYRLRPLQATNDSGCPIHLQPIPGQYSRVVDGHLQVLVSRQEKSGLNGFTTSQMTPGEADRQPNYFVDSTSNLVRRFADAAIGSGHIPQREVAEELARTTHRLIAENEESRGFSRASDVARAGVGDSTEQAVLLAALLRARDIPSQVAMGIRFSVEESDRMTYHAWTLAYVDGDWLHLDGTVGSVAAADRIALASSNLSGGEEYNAVLAMLELIGNIDIEVLRARY